MIPTRRPRPASRVASPLTLADSEPEPDLAVIALDAPRPYHPAAATLVIEVAVSSQRRDLGVKPALYAAAGAGSSISTAGRSSFTGGRERARTPRSSSCAADAVALPELVLADVLAAAAT